MELSNGTVADFFKSGAITVESVSYQPYKIRNTVCTDVSSAGASCIGAKTEPMRVTLEGYIKEDVDTARHLLCELCTPNTPIFLSDNGYTLELYASSALELSSEAHLRDKLLKYKIKAVAPSPFWSGEKKSQLFRGCGNISTDSNAIRLTNEGDAPVGCLIEAYFMTPCDSVMLRIGDKRFEYNLPVSVLDTLIIDTRHGKKSVRLLKNGESESFSVINKVLPASEFFTLPKGETRIDFNILNGLAYITVSYTPVYLRW